MLSTQIKRASNKRNLQEAFKNDDGAIDLASIMVGIIVIGIIGGVIAATVFAIIPWSQDNGAKQQLDSVASAEQAYRGLSSDQGTDQYGSADQLNNKGDSGNYGKLFDSNAAGVTIDLSKQTATEAHYTATITSKSGKVFSITDGGKPVEVTTPSTASGYQASISYTPSDGSTLDPADYHATSVDGGGGSFHVEGAYQENSSTYSSDVYNALVPLIDPNAPVVSEDNDAIYPDANQWYISRYGGNIQDHNFRPSTITFSNASGVIASYTPGSANVLQASIQADGSNPTYVYDGLIPSSVTSAQQSAIAAAQASNNLTVDMVIEGKTFHFNEQN